ncbi:Insulin-degrading enzyme [Hondaea fermentalgiana]|uniref:Insulin-degrading enzyme n=1 Tax=Hondaea fermentalgiana TaxID=2315210 RepID=A0A2R5G6X1_9STRA|nr:Insulin-degrading enzyme [Hondaea fermentalgiana]|eukprot:GBG26802.1 Insulin-degrading enzyme [Hondaea fermentalgiana]
MEAWEAPRKDAAAAGDAAVEVGPDLDATRPETDEKLYKLVTLKANGLECLLISDTYAAQGDEEEDEDDDDDEDENDGEDQDGKDNDDEEGDDDEEEDGPEQDHKDEESDEEDGAEASNSSGSSSNNGGESGDEGFADSGGRKRRAAVCASVGAGSFLDPEECQGLAHFLEHMLFMGSEKHPTENAFDAFISRTGGESNAYTEGEQTTFYFTTKVSALAEALDIFAQFFVSPLMLEDAVDRELNAIESEFQLSRSSEASRVQEVLCRTARKGHPLSLFGWGNLRSLREDPAAAGVDPLKKLREFYNKYYVAPNLKLVICAPLSLDELERLVVEQCSCIRACPEQDPAASADGDEDSECDSSPQNSEQAQQIFRPPTIAEFGFPFQGPTAAVREVGVDAPMELLLEERVSLQCVHFIVPIRDVHQLRLTWQIPTQLAAYLSKPHEFLSHLIGHESKGSILSIAKSRGWATSLMAGSDHGGYESNTACMLFPVQMTLTQKGMCEWKQVVALVMEYIGLLRAVGPQREVFEEMASLAEVDYRFLEESDPEDQVQELSGLMLAYRQLGRRDLLTGPYLLKEWKPEEIEALTAHFTPENVRIDLVSSYFGRDRDFKDQDDCADHGDDDDDSDGDENKDDKNDDEDDDECGDDNEDDDDDDEDEDEDEDEDDGDEEASDASAEAAQESTQPLRKEDFPENPALMPDLVPLEEPYFGTRFWIRRIDEPTLQSWQDALAGAEAHAKTVDPARSSSGLHIPEPNPYVPKDLSLREFPSEEALHPLVGSFVRVQTTSGWAYGFVQCFNAMTQQIEVAVEDDIEDTLRWFKLDETLATAWFSREADPAIDVFNVKTSQMQKIEIIAGGKSERGWQQLTAAAMRLFDLRHSESVANRCPEFAHFYEPRLASCSTEQVEMYWLHSRAFATPKVEISLNIVCGSDNAAMRSPLLSVASALFINLIGDELTNEAYMASMAGLDYKIRKSDSGMLVRFTGFTDRIFTLADIVLRHIFRHELNKNPADTARRYAMRRESLLRYYRNLNLKTGHHAVNMRLRVLKPRTFDAETLIEALDDPILQTHDGMLTLVREQVLSQVFVDGLICGNVVEADGARLHGIIASRIEAYQASAALERALFPRQPVIRLAPGEALRIERPCRDPNNANISLEMYFQIGEDQLRDRVLVDLIEELMEEPMYDTLRTKHQLGYSVSCSMRYTHKVLGYVVRVTSDTHTGDELEAHVFAFMQSFLTFLEEELDEEHFEDHLRTAVELKLEEDNNLSDESRRLWETIADHSYEWHTTRREAFSLFGLTRQDVVAAYKRWLLPTATSTLRVVSVRSAGPAFSRAPDATPLPPPDAVDPSLLPVFTSIDDFESLHEAHDHYSLIPSKREASDS